MGTRSRLMRQQPQAQSMKELHAMKIEYTALDMRLLHHYLTDDGARPHLPLGRTDVWKHEIPALAHEVGRP